MLPIIMGCNHTPASACFVVTCLGVLVGPLEDGLEVGVRARRAARHVAQEHLCVYRVVVWTRACVWVWVRVRVGVGVFRSLG